MERRSVEVSMGRRKWLISTISAADAVLSSGFIKNKKRWKQTQIYQQSRPQWVERKTEQDEMKVLQTEIEKNKWTRRKSDRFTERGKPKGVQG